MKLRAFFITIITAVVFLLIANTSYSQNNNEEEVKINDTVVVASPSDSIYEEEATAHSEKVNESFSSFKIYDTAFEKNYTARIHLKDTFDKLKKKEEYWYYDYVEAEKERKKNNSRKDSLKPDKNDQDNTSNTSSGYPGNLGFITWLIVIAAFFIIIFLFLKANGISLFASRAKNIELTESTETISDNIFEIDFESAIDRTIKNRDYRLATRLLFLRLIKTMANKSVIDYSPDKTNFDYLFALSGTKAYNDFAQAVRAFEYVWYGEFGLTENQFSQVKQQFDKLQNSL